MALPIKTSELLKKTGDGSGLSGVLKIDQTTRQPIENNHLRYDETVAPPDHPRDIPDKAYTDATASALGLNYYLRKADHDPAITDPEGGPNYKMLTIDPSEREADEGYSEKAGIADQTNYVVQGWAGPSPAGVTKLLKGTYSLYAQVEKLAGRDVRFFGRLYLRNIDTGVETQVGADSDLSEVVSANNVRENEFMQATLANDVDVAADERLIGKIWVRGAGGGNPATVRVYYCGDINSYFGFPTNKAVLDQMYAPFTHDNDNHSKDFAEAGEVPSGATLPTSPTEGYRFLHTPTGRNVAMRYVGGTWYPDTSFGSMTLYVDGTLGTDAPGKGTGTGADAFATVQYAVNMIPGSYGGDVYIEVAAGTYAENVVIQGKNATGAYNIYINGTLAEQETIASCTITAGTGAQRGVIHKASGFNVGTNDYTNLLAYFVTDDAYRVIDGHASTISFNSGSAEISVGDVIEGATSGAFADVLTVTVTSGTWGGGDAAGTIEMLVTYGTWQDAENIDNDTDSAANVATTASTASANNDKIVTVGTCPSATSQDVIIYDWETIISEGPLFYSSGIIFDSVKIQNNLRLFEVSANGECRFNYCCLANESGPATMGSSSGNVEFFNSMVNLVGAYFVVGGKEDFQQTKLKTTGIQAYRKNGGSGSFRQGSIVEGGTSFGIRVDSNAALLMGSAVAAGFVRVRNNGTGLYAINGGVVAGTANNVYSNNTTDKNGVAASFGYID